MLKRLHGYIYVIELMSTQRRERRKLRRNNSEKIQALLNYKKAVELQLSYMESTKSPIRISKDDFLFVYEGKDEKRDNVLKGLSHYMTLVRVEYELLGHGYPIKNGFIHLNSIPVFDVPEETVKEVLSKR